MNCFQSPGAPDQPLSPRPDGSDRERRPGDGAHPDDDTRRDSERRYQSERDYRHLFDQVQEGVLITTPDGRILDANPAAVALSGYTRAELLDMNVAELYADPEERQKVVEAIEREGACELEVRGRKKSGEEIICQLSVTVRRGQDGAAQAFQTLIRDVTEKRQAEKALRESEAKFRALTEEAVVGVALIQDGAFEYVNERYAKIVGYEREELIGMPPVEAVVHPDDRSKVREMMRRRLEGEAEAVRYRTRIRTKEGETRHVEVYGRIFTYRGRAAVIGSVLDVTEKRRLQRDVLNMQEEERRRLGQDLHDGVAAQLAGVAMMLGSLARRSAADEELAAALREIQALVRESGGDVRRLSHGLAPAGLSGGELPVALRRLAQRIDGGWFERGPGLPGLKGETAAHLYWIAQEAASNAQRHAETDRIAIRLGREDGRRADGRREDGALILEIEDDGKGFVPERVEQEESLGLRTMRYRAELLGGMLTIDSEPGRGTCVRCRLPL